MDLSYVVTPFLAWLCAGSLKFCINSICSRRLAFGLVGYGGLPSNHSAIVSSVTALVGVKEGVSHPAFGVALTLAFIVMLDAGSLRQQVGLHAVALNRIRRPEANENEVVLRERMGHTRIEILAGILVGVTVAIIVAELGAIVTFQV